MGSAYLQFEEAAKGSISKGKRADLVLLSDDPARIAPSGIEAIRVLTTIIGGKVAFERRNGRETFGF